MRRGAMLNCGEVEARLAAYVDGYDERGAAGRDSIDAHLRACPSCRASAAAEQTAHELLRARRTELRGTAPEGLRQRCAASRAPFVPASPAVIHRGRWVPLSFAATLGLAAMLFLVLFGVGGSVETYAAQLAADHIKCFQFPPSAAKGDVNALGVDWQRDNGWPLRIAPGAAAEELELIGLRRCGSTRGRLAHMLYRWRGEPLSVYVLNAQVPQAADASLEADAHDAVRRFGEQEIIWSDRGRTYAVVARASLPDLQRVASYVRRRVE